MSSRPVSTLSLAFAIGLLTVALIGPADAAAAAEKAAATPTPYAGFDGTACEADFNLNCTQAVSENMGYNCLRTFYKRDALSPECAELTESLHSKRQEKAVARLLAWKTACESDISKHCAEYADGRAATIKGCLGRHRDELSKECNEELPFRPGYKGHGSVRWRDGSEPEDWALKNAMEDRPRKTQQMLDEKGEEAVQAELNAKSKAKDAEGKSANKARVETQEAAAAAGAGEPAPAQESADAE